MHISPSIVRFVTISALLLLPVAAQASTARRFYVPVDMRADRPTARSIERSANVRWDNQAALRRRFMRQLESIEEVKDSIAPEYTPTVSPQFKTDVQGFIPYNWYRTRRHVRHLHWNSEFQIEPDAKLGEGPAGQRQSSSASSASSQSSGSSAQ